jgi:Uma2 family endonuclease
MSIELMTRRRFTVDEYHRMSESGILRAGDRVELIRGDIVDKSPIGSRHAACVALLTEALVARLAGRAVIWPQNPVALPPDSEPQPDLAVLRFRHDRYGSALPSPGDVLLLVEVADSTLRYDREVKLPLYAESGILEVWIIDLEHDRIEVYRSPGPDGYRAVRQVSRSEVLAPEAFPDVELSIADICG